MLKFSIIAAADQKMGIGVKNGLPWRLPGDLQYFGKITTEAAEGMRNAVIMGRKTWDSLPKKHRPLKDRLNVVLSRGHVELPEGVFLEHSLDDALERVRDMDDIEQIFIVGGANLYAQAIEHPNCDKIYLTEVLDTFECDAFFPSIPEKIFSLLSRSKEREENGVKYRFAVFGNNNFDK